MELSLIVGAVAIAFGVWLMLVGAAGSKLFDECSGCGDPMPDGFTSSDDAGRYCRGCTRKRGMSPWCWKKDFGEW